MIVVVLVVALEVAETRNGGISSGGWLAGMFSSGGRLSGMFRFTSVSRNELHCLSVNEAMKGTVTMNIKKQRSSKEA